MVLSHDQIARVRYLAKDHWKSWEDFDRVLGQMSAEELHEFVRTMNWDGGGAKRLLRVLVHPKCDRGTALMMYWRADPIYFLKYGSRDRVAAELSPTALEDWDLMRDIERRLERANSFSSAKIPYDPRNDSGRDRTVQQRAKRPIPIVKNVGGKLQKVGEEARPDEPPLDVHALLPQVVFQPVGGS